MIDPLNAFFMSAFFLCCLYGSVPETVSSFRIRIDYDSSRHFMM
jgi:hypothetical protein